MNIQKTLVLAAMAAAATFAQAENIEWDLHDQIEVGVGVVDAGDISESFSFRLNEDSSLYATAVANNLNGTFNIDNGFVSLLKLDTANNTEQLISSFSFSGTTGDVSTYFGNQSVGDYVYRITGSANGTAGGVFSLTSAVAAVPEASTMALMLVGLAGIGLAQHRRRNHR